MKLITDDAIAGLLDRAASQPRRRAHRNMHESPADPVQRFVVAAKRDSYFRPHRHPGKWEVAVVIRGGFDVVEFDDRGVVLERHSVGPGAEATAFELARGVWHCWIPTAEDSVFIEIKEGPYDAATASEFAAWSAAEGSPDAPSFADRLRRCDIGGKVA